TATNARTFDQRMAGSLSSARAWRNLVPRGPRPRRAPRHEDFPAAPAGTGLSSPADRSDADARRRRQGQGERNRAGRAVAAHLRGGRLAVLDLQAGRLERTLVLSPAGAASEAVALDRVGAEVWVALRPPQPSTMPGALRRLDEATLAPLGDLPTGADPGALLA